MLLSAREARRYKAGQRADVGLAALNATGSCA